MAFAPVPAPPEKLITGGNVYPVPAFVIMIPESDPDVIIAIAIAPLPVVSPDALVKIIVGALVYPDPPSAIKTDSIRPSTKSILALEPNKIKLSWSVTFNAVAESLLSVSSFLILLFLPAINVLNTNWSSGLTGSDAVVLFNSPTILFCPKT